MYEGVGKMLLEEIMHAIKSTPISLIGGALIKGTLKGTLKKCARVLADRRTLHRGLRAEVR